MFNRDYQRGLSITQSTLSRDWRYLKDIMPQVDQIKTMIAEKEEQTRMKNINKTLKRITVSWEQHRRLRGKIH